MSLRGYVPPDPETQVSQVRYAVIQTPRKNRKRFPAGCVHLMEDRKDAVAQANPARNLHAAQVIGPSKSSEGQYIFYLVEWLV